MQETVERTASKVAAVTLGFWIIKIAATTLGEIGGDAVTMGDISTTSSTASHSYLLGTAIFGTIFLGIVACQIAARRFHPFLYWAVIIAGTTVGTTLADLVDRSLGIGYLGGSTLLLTLVLCSLAAWYVTLGSVAVETITKPAAEAFYWVTITFSQTLGTALGDWAADSGLGYGGGALVFGAALAAVGAAYLWTRISRTALFWTAFILTRPLGATVGDFLDKPYAQGGLELSRYMASATLLVFIVACVALLPQKPAERHA